MACAAKPTTVATARSVARNYCAVCFGIQGRRRELARGVRGLVWGSGRHQSLIFLLKD